jgi:hypothetical protein
MDIILKPQDHGIVLEPRQMIYCTDLLYDLCETRSVRPLQDVWINREFRHFTDQDQQVLEQCLYKLFEFGHIAIYEGRGGVMVFEILIKKLKKRVTRRRLKKREE